MVTVRVSLTMAPLLLSVGAGKVLAKACLQAMECLLVSMTVHKTMARVCSQAMGQL